MNVISAFKKQKYCDKIHDSLENLNYNIEIVMSNISQLQIMLDFEEIEQTEELKQIEKCYDNLDKFFQMSREIVVFSKSESELVTLEKEFIEKIDLARKSGISKNQLMEYIDEIYKNELDVEQIVV